MKKVPVLNEDRNKSYFKYYLCDMAQEPKEKIDKIQHGPSANAIAPRIENRNDLFKPGNMPEEFGWWKLEDGTAVIANRTLFPGVTGEMFDWWFAWHPIDRLRYTIWDSEEHYDVTLEDYPKALDPGLTLRERHWGSVHHVWEDIGTGNVDYLKISFKRPIEMGYDEEKLDTEACNALVCSNVLVAGNQTMFDVPVVMTHFLRPAPGGSELRSRFWFGWQIIDGNAVRSIPEGAEVPVEGPVALLRHNVKEFTNLAAILPSVYAEESGIMD